MRGHPLGGRAARLLIGSLVVPLVVACVATDRAAETAVVDVTVSSVPGDAMAFDPGETVVRWTGPISVTFRNASTLPHNLTFTSGVAAATRTIVEPGTSDQLALGPLAPGAYRFVCTIHDGMSGTLVVESTG